MEVDSSPILMVAGEDLRDSLSCTDKDWLTLVGLHIQHTRLGEGKITAIEYSKNENPFIYISFGGYRERKFSERIFDQSILPYISVPETHPLTLRHPDIFHTPQQFEERERLRSEHPSQSKASAEPVKENSKRHAVTSVVEGKRWIHEVVEKRRKRIELGELQQKIALREQAEERESRLQQAMLYRQIEKDARKEEERREQAINILRSSYHNSIPQTIRLTDKDIELLQNLDGASLSNVLESNLANSRRFVVLAIYFTWEYRKHGRLGILAKACKYWRKVNRPKLAIELSESIKYFQRNFEWAMVWNSRAGALADLNRLDEAGQCGLAALDIQPNMPHSYNVMGRICLKQGLDKEGLAYYQRADELSDNRTIVANSLLSAIDELSPERQAQIRLAISERAESDTRFEWLNDVPF